MADIVENIFIFGVKGLIRIEGRLDQLEENDPKYNFIQNPFSVYSFHRLTVSFNVCTWNVANIS